MSKKTEKASVGCRVLVSKVSEIDSAADAEGMNRAEWIEYAIDKALGKRPRRSLLSRVARVEQMVKALAEKVAA